MRSSLLLYGLLAYAGLQAVLVTAQEPRGRIIFPHVTHIEDMGLECGECHEGVETSTRLTHDLLPVMDQCSACHDGDTASEECSACHTRPDDPTTYTWQPTPGLLFPHQTHLPQTECSQCHPEVAGVASLVPRTPPKMEPCMDCHAVPLTDAGCYACHASLEGKLPASHSLGWTQNHGLFAQGTSDEGCAMCHQLSDCESCHAQAQLEKKVHPANYEFLHAGDFMGFELECGTCHAMPQECQSCHLAKGVMPLSHNHIAWVVSPFATVSIPTPNLHSQEALDKPDYCVACHEPAVDATCLRVGCHAD